jgi:hypothetical protein
MAKTPIIDKKKFTRKLLEFQKKGLLQYGKYLTDQLKFASRTELRKHYKKYVEDQLALNERKIKKIDIKLSGKPK